MAKERLCMAISSLETGLDFLVRTIALRYAVTHLFVLSIVKYLLRDSGACKIIKNYELPAAMLTAVLSCFALAILAPWLTGLFKDRIGWLLALLPLGLTAYFISHVPAVSNGQVVLQSWDWLPGLGINLSFMLDGLSLLFALLISFIGTFILIYAGSYLRGHRYLGRFYAIILCFMASMLGVVLSDNLISLFVFWELTSITSYLLIGFDHEKNNARKYALQGLLVTFAGGLALMAGLIMLAMAGGGYQFSEILASDNDLLTSSFTVGMILCILLGAVTPSAPFPFSLLLPHAIAAPTPVP